MQNAEFLPKRWLLHSAFCISSNGYTAPGADSPCPAFRNNTADPANSMKNAFPPNPLNSGGVQEVSWGFRVTNKISATARTKA